MSDGTPEEPEQELDVEEIDVPHVPEPDEPEEGVIDPEDTHVEGVDAAEDLRRVTLTPVDESEDRW